MEINFKKRYTKIHGVKIAHKGELPDLRYVHGLLDAGVCSGVLPNGGWWIVAKEIN